MKMTKKILLAAVAVASAVMFTSCDFLNGTKTLSDAFQKKVDDNDILGYSDSSAVSLWNIDGENASDTEKVRAIQFLQTKHSDMAGLVRINLDAETEGYSAAGVVGVLFDASSSKDVDGNPTYSFGVAAVGVATHKYYYVSYFANVKEADLGKDNFGVTETKTAIDTEATDPYEIRYTGTSASKGLVYLSSSQETACTVTEDEKDTLTVVVDVDENEDGSYTVRFYDAGVVGKNDTLTVAADKTAMAEVTMSAASLGKSEAKQAQCGCYAMVNNKSELTGSLSILELTHEAIPVEE